MIRATPRYSNHSRVVRFLEARSPYRMVAPVFDIRYDLLTVGAKEPSYQEAVFVTERETPRK
jgi:hypothetical protein